MAADAQNPSAPAEIGPVRDPRRTCGTVSRTSGARAACGMREERAQSCATKLVANWSRSNSCLATFRSKRQSVTWDANNAFAMQ